MNYPDNPYPFRQDSSFLYFFGLDLPNLTAVIDVDDEGEVVFGSDLTVEDLVWMGRQPALSEQCEEIGVRETLPLEKLESTLRESARRGREIHFLPQYRAENVLRIAQTLGIAPAEVSRRVSETLVNAVVAQRSIKSREEIAEIETALDITREMHTLAMKMTKPGVYEKEVVGAMEGIALSKGVGLAFPTIFSVHGEILHNHYHGNRMSEGDLVVNDSGVESPSHYASDITRTIPVSGRFTEKQKEIYSIVLNAQEKAIEAVKPGVEFRDVHRLASTILASGLKQIGLIKGDVEEAVEAGAHTLFFPCGLGHMIGLDVHDMEGLGEDSVGYTETIKRKPEFGWRSLRLAKALEPGFVITAEPGIYFIPELIQRWKADRKCSEFVNYSKIDEYCDFGGIRIEDDVLVLQEGCRILGKRIPKTVEEVEDARSNA
jgi:Xaa-Pro aminopeptidase